MSEQAQTPALAQGQFQVTAVHDLPSADRERMGKKDRTVDVRLWSERVIRVTLPLETWSDQALAKAVKEKVGVLAKVHTI